jgi:glycosyltransferase involved in cell wall biosynthesis
VPDTGKTTILYLDTAPAVGGSVISLLELLKGLDKQVYQPVVVTYTGHPYVQRYEQAGAQVVVWNEYQRPDHRPSWTGPIRQAVPVKRWKEGKVGSRVYHGLGLGLWLVRRGLPRASRLLGVARKYGASLVHTNIRVGHDREGIIAAWLGRLPCLCHVRHQESLGWFDRRLAGSVDQFIYISKAVQDSHLSSGIGQDRGRVVYNGVSTADWRRALDPARGRELLGVRPGVPLVGIVARLDSWKGHAVFLRAMARLKEIAPEARGVVVGDAPPELPEYRQELETLSDQLGLAETVSFVPFQTELAPVMSALDVAVLASTTPEPFGRVLIEAMAAGRPVIASDSGASREIIDDGQQGILFPPGDHDALASAIARVLSDPALAAEMGRRGQMRVAERFEAAQYVAGVEAVYQDVLANHAR